MIRLSKKWPEYHVERDFNRYLQDQSLAVCGKEFIADGKEHIDACRASGGAFVICLWLPPKIWPDSPG